ncbi:helix-turn-helix domain-containing protein [Streptomyces sp. NPDC059441]|uniref:helix-turn-helix domain-containing protein n=1 Tax=Streptomyces sp. NPDC059441 TaxID=3346829 RepID=UPI0036BEAEDB
MGGLTTERRAACEGIRLEAGQRFARGDRTSVIAKDLRVSERSVEQWRRNWREGGIEGLKSKGPAKLPKLSDERFALLEKELAKGPAAHGWEDQRWTLERVSADRPPVQGPLLDRGSVAAAAPPRLVLAEPGPTRAGT